MDQKKNGKSRIIIIAVTEFGEFMIDGNFKPLGLGRIEPIMTIRIQQESLFPEDDLEEMRLCMTQESIKEMFQNALILKSIRLFGDLSSTAADVWQKMSGTTQG